MAQAPKLHSQYIDNDAFTRQFRKKQRAQLKLRRSAGNPSPTPPVSLQIMEGYELCPPGEVPEDQTELLEPLQPRDKECCFMKVLNQQTVFQPLPPIELIPQPPEIPKSRVTGHAGLQSQVRGLPPSSKKHLSAAALGVMIHRLQQDPGKYEAFTERVQDHIKPKRKGHSLGIRRNIENASHHLPNERRQLLTARNHLRRLHMEDVQSRGSGLKTARAAGHEAKMLANEQKRTQGVARIACRFTMRKQQKASFVVALYSRTSLLVKKLIETRERQFSKMKRLIAVVRIQRCARSWIHYKIGKQRDQAQVVIMRAYKMGQIRKTLRNRRQAAHCLLSWLKSNSQTSMPYLLAIHKLIDTTKFLQRYWRCVHDMWHVRYTLHEDQWIREEQEVLQGLRKDLMGEARASVPIAIPDCFRTPVLQRYMVAAKRQHISRVKKFYSTSQIFMRRHRRAIDQTLAAALRAGQISIKTSREQFLQTFMPDIYESKPKRPFYPFAVPKAQLEELILEAAQLAMGSR